MLIVPVIIWCWMSMDTTTALLFTIYMIPVNLLDNVLRPIVMARGLATPMVVIFIGVIGGALSFGITGLFLGPITLAVIWELWRPGSNRAMAPLIKAAAPDVTPGVERRGALVVQERREMRRRLSCDPRQWRYNPSPIFFVPANPGWRSREAQMTSENPAGGKHMLEDDTFMSVADLKKYVTQRELGESQRFSWRTMSRRGEGAQGIYAKTRRSRW